jgi:hypothetical protein
MIVIMHFVQNVLLAQVQSEPTAVITNVGDFEDVSNSAEVEQKANLKNNDCDNALCSNVLLAQVQSEPTAVITNVGDFEDVSNSAEVEQQANLKNNDCDNSECTNFIESQFQSAFIDITNVGSGKYEDVSNSAEIEQKADQENKDCDGSICTNTIGTQAQSASITNIVGGGSGNYEDVSNSAEVEQKADQENKDCDGSICTNTIDPQEDTQAQSASITNVVGGVSGDHYEDVSNSAEIEQKADQENKDCDGSICENFIGSQSQATTISNVVGGSSGDSYEDVSNSAEVEQKADQENKDCDGSICENFIDSQSQSASITNVVGGSSGDSYEDVSNSAEVEQKADQQNKDCNNSSCENFVGVQTQLASITNFIGGGSGGGSYEDVSNSAEIEQKAEQENKNCDESDCINNIATAAAIEGAATGSQTQEGFITNQIGGSGGSYEDVSNSGEVEQKADQQTKDCDNSSCDNNIATASAIEGAATGSQIQGTDITNQIGGSGGTYEDVSNSAEVEQEAEQKNKDCDGDSICDNNIATASAIQGAASGSQIQETDITNQIGGSGGSYEDVSNSAEVEQEAEQKNNNCDGSICDNNIATASAIQGAASGSQIQGTDITNQIGGSGGTYEDVSNSAEVEQKVDQQNKDCDGDSICDNNVATAVAVDNAAASASQSQVATITNQIGGGSGDHYEDVSNSAEVEQKVDQQNKDCDGDSICDNNVATAVAVDNAAASASQSQVATITNQIGGSGGTYEDVSNSAEVEQVVEQKNEDCKNGSLCENNIASAVAIGGSASEIQSQAATITNTIGATDGDGNYEDVSNSAEVEQKVDQQNKDCNASDCENVVDIQTQTALISNTVGGSSSGGEYHDVSIVLN